MHIKRKTIPKIWPISRTGTKYMAVPNHSKNEAVTLIAAMREILNIVKNRKELKKLLNEKKLIVNGKIVQEKNYPVRLFDSISLPDVKKHYRAILENKKLSFKEISESEAQKSVSKVIGKTILPGKKTQLNLSNGRNILSEEKIKTGSFVLVDNAKNKILRVILLEKGAEVVVIKGKHIGKKGKLKDIAKEGENSVAKIKTEGGEVSTNIENLFALE